MRLNLSSYSDNDLIDLMKSEKKVSDAAFIELYDRYAIKVNAYCRTIVQNKHQAEDIFQETFLRFYQNINNNDKSGSVIGYLIRIARNLCLNYKRDRKQNVPLEEFDLSLTDNNSYENKELSELLMMSLDLLDSESHEVLIMRVFNDMAYEDIAEILGITAARARYLVFKSKAKLKNILAPYFKDVF